jgi:precorrin-6B methylase 1
MTLYLQDVKILHNACVDILNECPEMIGYERVMNKLRMVIEAQELVKP